ncbi:MAG: RICIN domain-containing protein [Mucilaginibacter sp.]
MKISIPVLSVISCLLLLLHSCKKESAKNAAQQQGSNLRLTDTRPPGEEMRGIVPTGAYRIVTDITYSSGKQTLSVVGGAVPDGAKIEQRDYVPGTGQEWVAQSMGNNEYLLVNTNSGKALQVPVSYEPGVQLEQKVLNANLPNQRWIGKYLGDGIYQVRSKLNPELGVNVESDTAKNGAKITLNTLTNRRSYFLLYRTGYKDVVATHFFQRKTGWVAGDGGYSIPLQNNKVLWTFGDSYLDTYNEANNTLPCIYSINNATILQQKNNWTPDDGLTITGTGTKKTLFKDGTKSIYWPVSGFQLKDTVYVFTAGLMPDTGPGNWNGWSPTKYDIMYKMKYPEMTLAGYKVLDQDFGKYNFGIGFVKDDASGYMYVYGHTTIFLENSVHVARFPISNPDAKWTFWDGSKWVSDVNKVATIGIGDSPGVSVCKVKDKYVMLSTEITFECDNGKRIFSAVSNSITGPFSQRKAIYTIPDIYQGHTPLFYVPSGHPEYVNDRDELLITYAISGYAPCVPLCVNGRSIRDHYTVKAARIPLKMIDPTF